MSTFTVCLTHDVDRVYKTYQYLTHDVRKLRLSGLRTLFTGERPYWCFGRIMEMEERLGVRSSWYFLDETIRPDWLRPSSWKLSFGRYRVDDPRVASAIRELDAGGWEVGLHGSYLSYRDAALLAREKGILEEVLGHPVVGIRQHYLNLDVPRTWQLQRQVGLRYDASLGLRRGIGFPEGRRHPFLDEASGMWVIPLAIMEAYLFALAGGDPERAWRLALPVIDEAQAHGATLVLLWHPHLYNEDDFPGYSPLYERLIRECQSRGARFLTCGQVHAEAVAHTAGGGPRVSGGG
jgi:peptidoglycan/xylan/chitin deacetylase (PgdA/CDA1 family)